MKMLNKIINYIKIIMIARFGIKREFKIRSEIFGIRYFLCSSKVEIFRTFCYGGEEKALGVFLFLLRKEDVVWDIGASVGLYTVYAALSVKKIISFEPDPNIYKCLVKNIQINNLRNIETYPIGISHKKGAITLQTDGVDGNSPTFLNLKRHKNSTLVQTDTIDNLTNEGLLPPTVLKIDIEGAEEMALRGAASLLSSNNKPRLIFMEVHPDFLPNPQENEQYILNILKDNGYKILNIQKREEQYHLIAVILE